MYRRLCDARCSVTGPWISANFPFKSTLYLLDFYQSWLHPVSETENPPAIWPKSVFFFFLHGSLCLDQPSSNSSCWVGLYYLSEFPPCLGEAVFPKVGDVSLGEEPLPQWGNTVSRLEFIRCTAVRNRVLNRHPEASRHEHTLKQGLNGQWSQLSHPAIPHLQERLSNTAKVPNSVQCWWTRATSPKHRYLTSWE